MALMGVLTLRGSQKGTVTLPKWIASSIWAEHARMLPHEKVEQQSTAEQRGKRLANRAVAARRARGFRRPWRRTSSPHEGRLASCRHGMVLRGDFSQLLPIRKGRLSLSRRLARRRSEIAPSHGLMTPRQALARTRFSWQLPGLTACTSQFPPSQPRRRAQLAHKPNPNLADIACRMEL